MNMRSGAHAAALVVAGLMMAIGCGGAKPAVDGSAGGADGAATGSGGRGGSGVSTGGAGVSTGGAGAGTGGAAVSTGGAGAGTGGAASGGRSGGNGGPGGAGGGGGARGTGGGGGGSAGQGGGGGAASGGAGGIGGGAGGAGGGGSLYSGCHFIGGLNRVVVARQDVARGLCVTIVFSNGTNTSQVTLPTDWRVEYAFAFPSGGQCATRNAPVGALASTAQAGTATWPSTPSLSRATVDVTLTFPASATIPAMTSERLQANNVDISPGCAM